MTGEQMIAKAIFLLGYNDMNGNTNDPRFQATAKNALNFIYSDLFYINRAEGFKEMEGFSDEIDLSERAIFDVMPYGVAAFIAQAIGDGENQRYFSQLYNLKRKVLAEPGTITDAIPSV